jgi:hypothetical protein
MRCLRRPRLSAVAYEQCAKCAVLAVYMTCVKSKRSTRFFEAAALSQYFKTPAVQYLCSWSRWLYQYAEQGDIIRRIAKEALKPSRYVQA